MQKATLRLYRAISVPTEHLFATVGLDRTALVEKANEAIHKDFAPFSPRFRIFWPSQGYDITVVGIDVMSFCIESADRTPRAGLVTCDPMVPSDVHEADGALQAELQRLGIWTETKNYEWRAWYEIEKIREDTQP
jgi:hypothetical protein